jgi:hypothetical protein
VPPGELGSLVSLGLDIPVNTGFFQILPVILITQQYDLYLGLPGWTIYLLVVVLHPLQHHATWCCGCSCSCCTVWGVVVTIVVPRGGHRRCHCAVWGATVAVVALCMASQLLLLHHICVVVAVVV